MGINLAFKGLMPLVVLEGFGTVRSEVCVYYTSSANGVELCIA